MDNAHIEEDKLEDDIITLNVGGELFTTAKSTLLKGKGIGYKLIEAGGETYFSKLFSGTYKVRLDKNGNPFIDR